LLEAINGCLLFFMYRRWNNRIALVFWLSTLLFLYARTLFWPFSSSVFLYFSFTFILPYFLLAFPLFSSWIQQAVEKFIFIGFALVFATAYTGYYFVVFRGSFDILAFSTALLCGSILLFLAFISLRSKSSNRSAHLFH
jgi:hypothetical protein